MDRSHHFVEKKILIEPLFVQWTSKLEDGGGVYTSIPAIQKKNFMRLLRHPNREVNPYEECCYFCSFFVYSRTPRTLQDAKVGAKVGVKVATFLTGLLPRKVVKIALSDVIIYFSFFCIKWIFHKQNKQARKPETSFKWDTRVLCGQMSVIAI